MPKWQGALIAAVAIAAVLAVAIVATGLVLIIAPVAFVAILAYRFFAGRSAARRDASAAAQPPVIDAEYEVISDERRDRPAAGSAGRNQDDRR